LKITYISLICLALKRRTMPCYCKRVVGCDVMESLRARKNILDVSLKV